MSRYFARIENGIAIQVVVCNDPDWLTDRLGGTWVETKMDDPTERYCGPGYGVDESFPERFAPPWKQPEGAHDALPEGALVFHKGRIWRSTTPDNVWEPGVSGWHDQPLDDSAPQWVQPTGSHDAYNTGDRVTFNGSVYESTIDGNVWSPTDYPAGWTLIE